jgi:hypothetical protein
VRVQHGGPHAERDARGRTRTLREMPEQCHRARRCVRRVQATSDKKCDDLAARVITNSELDCVDRLPLPGVFSFRPVQRARCVTQRLPSYIICDLTHPASFRNAERSSTPNVAPKCDATMDMATQWRV